MREGFQKAFDIRARLRSFRCAIAGLCTVIATQPNAWIHAAATVCTVSMGAILKVSATDWALLVLAMAAVWSAEALNTALERLADAATPDFHPLVKQAKDTAAAAVLVAAGGSVVIGLLVLGPPLWECLMRLR